MRKLVVLLVVLFPFFVQAQVVSCHKTTLKKSETDTWEKVNYNLRIFEFKDSTVLREITKILQFNLLFDSDIRVKSEKVTSILTMWFKQSSPDTLICQASYSDKPYLYDELRGCCLMACYYVQLVGAIPSFLTPTNDVASFSYLSHKVKMGNYDGFEWELEEMGDDSVPQWIIEFSNKNVRLLRYYGVDD